MLAIPSSSADGFKSSNSSDLHRYPIMYITLKEAILKSGFLILPQYYYYYYYYYLNAS